MAKLFVVSALLFVAFFALVAEASFRTTINTIVEEDNESRQPQRCQQQIQQRQQQLRQCQQWLSQGSRYGMDSIDEYARGGQQQQHRQCCQGLKSLDRQCRCEAVSQIVQQQQRQGGRQRGQRQEEIVEKAMYLPDSCNLDPRQCQVQSPSFRTTISTIVEEDNEQKGSQQSQRCQHQIQQRQQQLQQCQQWLSQGSRYGMDVIGQYGRGDQHQQQQQHRQCCQGLESLDRQCRCEAVSQIVQEQQQQGQGERQSSERQEHIVEKARFLPDSCNLEPRQCQVQRPYY